MSEPGGCEPGASGAAAEEWNEGPGSASSPHHHQHHQQQQLAQNMQQMHIAQQQQQQHSAHVPSASVAASAASPSRPSPSRLSLQDFLLTPALNSLLARFLATRDLFFLQFLNRSCFTLLNSNAQLLREYYAEARLDSFIPFMVDDAFLAAFLTPTYLALADGSTAVRNTYSMHIRHMHLNFCTRISNKSLGSIAQHIGPRLLSINLEGGGRSRINETGMRTLFGACTNLTAVNLNGKWTPHGMLGARSCKASMQACSTGPACLLRRLAERLYLLVLCAVVCSHTGFYQLNMVDTIGSLIANCAHSLTELSLNGCAQLNDAAIGLLAKAKIQSVGCVLHTHPAWHGCVRDNLGGESHAHSYVLFFFLPLCFSRCLFPCLPCVVLVRLFRFPLCVSLPPDVCG